MRTTKGSIVITFKTRVGETPLAVRETDVANCINVETKRSDDEQRKLGNVSGVVDLPMTLRIEGPIVPDITLIDLPGIKYERR
jgi:hypothetical protein